MWNDTNAEHVVLPILSYFLQDADIFKSSHILECELHQLHHSNKTNKNDISS